jgi:hypothetical protein
MAERGDVPGSIRVARSRLPLQDLRLRRAPARTFGYGYVLPRIRPHA